MTLHVAHVLSQIVSGLLSGDHGEQKAADKQILLVKNEDVDFLTAQRLEFRDGTHKPHICI